MNRSIGDFGSVAIGRPNHLSRTKTAPGNQTITNIRPVITPCVRIDPRCPAKLAPRHHRDILVHPPIVQIGNQGMHPLVKHREVGIFAFTKIAGMKIPAAEVECHHARPRFDQSPSHQELFEVSRGTVAVIVWIPFPISSQQGGIFAGNIQRFRQPTRSQDPQCLSVQRIEPVHHPLRIRFPAKIVETLEQLLPIRKPTQVDSIQLHVIPRGTRRTKRRMGDTQKARVPR